MHFFLKLQLICVLLYDVQYCNVPIGDFVLNVHGSAYLVEGRAYRAPNVQTYKKDTKYKRKRTKLTPCEAMLLVLSLKLVSPKQFGNSNSY